MAVVVESVATNSGNVTALVIDKPSGTVQGDLLVIHVAGEINTALSFPSGFTQINQGTNSSGGVTCGMAWKIAGASEGTTYSIDVSNGNNVGIILRISGFNATTPINTYSQTINDSAQTTATVSAVTPTVANSLLLICVGWGDGINTGTPSITNNNPSWSEKYDLIRGFTAGAVYTGTYTATTTTGAGAMPRQSSGGGKNVTHLVAINPLVASGPANLKSYNTNLKANIKTINTNPIANVKTLNTNA